MSGERREVIIVRSLTGSDLGLFAALRPSAKSKQRAININSDIAKRLFSDSLFESGGMELDCICSFEGVVMRSPRYVGKIHKNWRLGGEKIEGKVFGQLDSSDFALIRSVEGNDGGSPIVLTFVSRTTDPARHAAISKFVTGQLKQSMLVVGSGDAGFQEMSGYCPPLPAPLPVAPVATLPLVVPVSRPIPPMPFDPKPSARKRTIQEKINSPHIIEQMMKVAGDLSAPLSSGFLIPSSSSPRSCGVCC